MSTHVCADRIVDFRCRAASASVVKKRKGVTSTCRETDKLGEASTCAGVRVKIKPLIPVSAINSPGIALNNEIAVSGPSQRNDIQLVGRLDHGALEAAINHKVSSGVGGSGGEQNQDEDAGSEAVINLGSLHMSFWSLMHRTLSAH